MARRFVADTFAHGKGRAGDLYRKLVIDRNISSLPTHAIVPLEQTDDVLLLCSRRLPRFDPEPYIQELAFAHELASRGRTFAVSEDPSAIFEKSVMWFLPRAFLSPRLWDYSHQVYEFAAGLERQGNRLFCSAAETRYWENKSHMHRMFDERGVPTPRTRILAADNRASADFDLEPTLIKEEHSAGSTGIHYFKTAAAAREFVLGYHFRPTEHLIMQQVVRGGTKDLRLTMVGDQMIESASFWRIKTPEALSAQNWTTTASKYGTVIDHSGVPESVVPVVAEYLRKLELRTAGVDLMWVDDDLSREPLVLELSPFYQPNPPKPTRYEHLTYKQYKQKPYRKEGYLLQQYFVFREIAGRILDQQLF
jgi:glutathione synthase/RimK-type ligase-like ATP-grasp enzyme